MGRKTMTLAQYIKDLQAFLGYHPECLNLPVWYATDDEGNDFKPILYTASAFNYNGKDIVLVN